MWTLWSLWFPAMLCALPFMRGRALKVWFVLVFASLAGIMASTYIPAHADSAYVLIDMIAAGLVLYPRPMNLACKGIALLLGVMLAFEVGFLFSAGLNMAVFANTTIFIGWIQWALLLSWGLHDFLENTDFGGRAYHHLSYHRRDHG